MDTRDEQLLQDLLSMRWPDGQESPMAEDRAEAYAKSRLRAMESADAVGQAADNANSPRVREYAAGELERRAKNTS